MDTPSPTGSSADNEPIPSSIIREAATVSHRYILCAIELSVYSERGVGFPHRATSMSELSGPGRSIADSCCHWLALKTEYPLIDGGHNVCCKSGGIRALQLKSVVLLTLSQQRFEEPCQMEITRSLTVLVGLLLLFGINGCSQSPAAQPPGYIAGSISKSLNGEDRSPFRDNVAGRRLLRYPWMVR